MWGTPHPDPPPRWGQLWRWGGVDTPRPPQIPQGAIAPRGTAAPRCLFRAPRGPEGLAWGTGPPGNVGPGMAPAWGGRSGVFGEGGGCLSFAWDLHSGPCSSTKVHEVIDDGGRLLPLPPTVLPLCAAHAAWGVHRVSPPCTPDPPGGVWEQGRGCRGHPAALTSKAQSTQGSSEGLGGLPWRGVGKKSRVSGTPIPLGCWVQGSYAPPHTPKMPHSGEGHSPPNPSWPATPPERRGKPSAPAGAQRHPRCSAPHPL